MHGHKRVLQYIWCRRINIGWKRNCTNKANFSQRVSIFRNPNFQLQQTNFLTLEGSEKNRASSQAGERGRFQLQVEFFEDMAKIKLKDQDKLDGASNFVIWKARIYFLLDEHGLKTYADNVVAKPTNGDQLREFKKEDEVDDPGWSSGPYSLTHIGQEYTQGDVECSHRAIPESFRAVEDVLK